MRALIAVCSSILLSIPVQAQETVAVPLVEVVLIVRGPDGQPLLRTPVVVKIFRSSSFDPPIPDVATATDEEGAMRFQIPPGVHSMSITAHKVGYGSIGATEFLTGKIARIEAPPLAGYGSVDGTVPMEACTHDVTVQPSGSGWYGQPKAIPDSSGHFHLDDVPGGRWSFVAFAGGDYCSDFATATVVPHETRTISLRPIPPQIPGPTRSHGPAMPGPGATGGGQKDGEQVVWVRGTVRDEMGHPVADASVFAVSTYYGGIRMNGMTTKGTTDSHGYYEIKGPGGLPSFSATLIATAPGHPPAWAWPEFPQISWPDPQPPKDQVPPTQDMVLPSKGGAARITVLHDGKPFSGAIVALYLENANLQDVWALGGADKAVEDVAYPIAAADARGVATFDELLPGRYRVLATAGSVDMIRRSGFGVERPGGAGPSAAAGGVPVRIGQTTNYNLNIYTQSDLGSFKVFRDDRTPYAGLAAVRFGPVDAIAWTSSLTLDSSGLGHVTLGHPGFWRVETMYRDSPVTSFPIYPPYFEASGVIATSPNLTGTDAPVFTARRIEPGSLHLAVQDAEGNPIHATVEIRTFWELMASGTTDDQGSIEFSGLYNGATAGSASDNFFVQIPSANLRNSDLVDLSSVAGPLPSPQLLRTREAFLAQKLWEQRLPLAVNAESSVVERAVRLRYICGSIRSSAAPRSGPWAAWLDQEGVRYGATLRVLPGGEYVAGPFPSGPVKICFRDSIGSHSAQALVEVDARPDEPLHFDIDADKYAEAPQPVEKSSAAQGARELSTGSQVYLGMTGITTHSTGFKHLRGKIFLADGKTPALGALTLYYEAGSTEPTIVAMADALGDLQPRGIWRTAYQIASEQQKSALTSPVLVAFLPGSSGATIRTSPVRPDEPVRLVLPPPYLLSGRVIVGGVPPSKRAGSIYVHAAYQDGGFLNPVLSVDTTADADGRFTLAGLTPGTYVIQAALDQIWLSSQVKVHVPISGVRSVKLSISSPGAALRLKLQDSSGNPMIGESITIDRSGPLSSLWPRQWSSDGAGIVYIPTLEAGRHTIHTSASRMAVTINIPPLPANALHLKVVVDQPPR